VTYGYDPATGRFGSVTGPGLPSSGVNYGRVAGSELIGQAQFMDGATVALDTPLTRTRSIAALPRGASRVAAQITRTYESYRDVLDTVENHRYGVGAYTLLSRRDYAADAGGRRTQVLFSSDFAVTTTPRTDWGYDGRNELTSARAGRRPPLSGGCTITTRSAIARTPPQARARPRRTRPTA
jgi:hypothetical protein